MKLNLQNDAKPQKVCDAFKEFITYCKIKNLSKQTIEFYEECYDIFTDFFDEKNLTQDIKKDVVNNFIIYLQNNTKSNGISINTRLRGLRAILYYFMKIGYVSEFKIELIRTEKKIKETYTDAELELLLKKPDIKKCSFSVYRDWVTVNYLLSTGNRLETLINLKIEDINFDEGYIVLNKTKNRSQQIIPLSKTLSKILQEYLQYRKGEGQEYLFCNIYGKKLEKGSLQHSLQLYNHQRGVMKTSIHLYRHTFSKKWILAGGDVFRLQKILGHSSLDVVKEYVNIVRGHDSIQ